MAKKAGKARRKPTTGAPPVIGLPRDVRDAIRSRINQAVEDLVAAADCLRAARMCLYEAKQEEFTVCLASAYGRAETAQGEMNAIRQTASPAPRSKKGGAA